jgi:hypothetical protein
VESFSSGIETHTLVPALLIPIRITGSIALLLLLLATRVSSEHVLEELELSVGCCRQHQHEAEREFAMHVECMLLEAPNTVCTRRLSKY